MENFLRGREVWSGSYRSRLTTRYCSDLKCKIFSYIGNLGIISWNQSPETPLYDNYAQPAPDTLYFDANMVVGALQLIEASRSYPVVPRPFPISTVSGITTAAAPTRESMRRTIAITVGESREMLRFRECRCDLVRISLCGAKNCNWPPLA